MLNITIPDLTLEGKTNLETVVTFKGTTNKEVTLTISPTCGCTKGSQIIKVNGDFEFNVTYNARKYPAKITKTVNVHVLISGIKVISLAPKFTVNITE